VVGELAARDTCDRDHGLRTHQWLSHTTGEPTAGCRRLVRVANALRRTLTHVGAALARGDIGFEHARVLTDALNPRIADQLEELQIPLIERAGEVSFERWSQELRAIVELLDQDGGHDPNSDLSSNRLFITPLFNGTTQLHADLTPEHALTVSHALSSIADELFHRFANDHRADPTLPVPARSTLLALALVELCRRGLACDTTTSTAPRAELVVVVRDEQPELIALPDGTTMRRDLLPTLLDDPLIRLVSLRLDGTIRDVGRQRRLATTQQRQALAIRDGGCVFPGCSHPPTWTDAHHVIAWQDGGTTDLHNLALLCRHHHGVTHRSNWTMTVTADQWFTWTTPTGAIVQSQRHGRQRHGP